MYTQQPWNDGSSGGTPISAARLDVIETGIHDAHVTADAAVAGPILTESVQDIVGAMVVAGTNITKNYNDATGTLTISAAGGAGATNLAATLSASQTIITSDTGTDATIPSVDVTNAGVMTPTQKATLDSAVVDGDFTTNGLLKRTGSGAYGTAIAGTDYLSAAYQVPPPNGTDDTAAINAAWAAASPANTLQFQAGNYIYNGTGLDSAVLSGFGQIIALKGAGEFSTTITLGSTSYLMVPSHAISFLLLEDMRIEGGKGAIKQTHTGTCTLGTKHINRVRFNGYTECAIATEVTDGPFWFINECWFTAANGTGTIGVAMANGLTDSCTISKCTFQRNRIHVKCGNGGNNLRISDGCAFYQESAGDTNGMRASVWVIPNPSTNNGGNGFKCIGSKFSSEGMASGDLFFLYADQLSGASNGVRMPNIAADSTGVILGHTIEGCLFRPLDQTLFDASTYIPPIIYSTTPNVYGLDMPNNQLFDKVKYFIEFRTLPTTDWPNTGNTFGPVHKGSNYMWMGPQISNDPGIGVVDDPNNVLQTRSTVTRRNGSGSSASFAERLTTSASAFSTSSATLTAAIDAFGGTDAATVNITGDFGSAFATISNFIVGLPCWVEIDIAQPADTPMSAVRVAMHNFTGNLEHTTATLEIPAATLGWVTYAWSFVPRATASGLQPGIMVAAPLGTGGTTANYRGKVKFGRPRVYQSNERILGGRRPTITGAKGSNVALGSLLTQLDALGLINDTTTT